MNSEHGTYRLSYTPPEPTGYEEYPNINIEMSTSGDANVEQMLRFFEAFLSASGYLLKGDLQVVEREEKKTYNPLDFESVSAHTPSYGAAQPISPFSFVGEDVISFE
jgi:hypothetical protein